MSEFFWMNLKANLIAWGMGMVWLFGSVAVTYFICKKPRDFRIVLVIILMVSFWSFVAGSELIQFLKE